MSDFTKRPWQVVGAAVLDYNGDCVCSPTNSTYSSIIAAAPDMYEALKAAHDELSSIHGLFGDYKNSLEYSIALKMASDAIAKAEGK